MEENEKRIIESIAGNIIGLSSPLDFEHHVQNITYGIVRKTMEVEVINLTRNIKISGILVGTNTRVAEVSPKNNKKVSKSLSIQGLDKNIFNDFSTSNHFAARRFFEYVRILVLMPKFSEYYFAINDPCDKIYMYCIRYYAS